MDKLITLARLSQFLAKCKGVFAEKLHSHTSLEGEKITINAEKTVQLYGRAKIILSTGGISENQRIECTQDTLKLNYETTDAIVINRDGIALHYSNASSDAPPAIQIGYGSGIKIGRDDSGMHINGGSTEMTNEYTQLTTEDLNIFAKSLQFSWEYDTSVSWHQMLTPTANIPLGELEGIDQVNIIPDEEFTINTILEYVEFTPHAIITNESRTCTYVIIGKRVYLSAYPFYDNYKEAAGYSEMRSETNKFCYVFSQSGKWKLSIVVEQGKVDELVGDLQAKYEDAYQNVVSLDDLICKLSNLS